jgi:hypothetical protein
MKLEEYPNYGGLGRFDDGNLWNAVYPPSLGRYSYASSMNFPILNEIHETIDGSELVKNLDNDPGSAARLIKNGHKELLKKLAVMQPVNMNEYRQGMDNLLDRNLFMLRTEGPNKYTILANYDDVFSPVLRKVDAFDKDMCSFRSVITDCGVQDDINDVDMNGEKYLYVPTEKDYVEMTDNKGLFYADDGSKTFNQNKDGQTARPYVAHGDSPVAVFAEEFDHYVVRKKNGVEVQGFVIPKVIDFGMNLIPTKLFVGKTMSTMQEVISGHRVENSRFQLRHLKTEMKPGQTGTLIYQMNPSKCLATTPFTVVAMTIEPCGMQKITAQDLTGKPFRFEFASMDLEKIVNMGDKYLVPKKFFFVPMEGFNEVSNSPMDYAVKTASGYAPDRVIHTGHGRFAINSMNKVASQLGWDSSNLSRCQAQFLLGSAGLPKLASKAVAYAERFGESKVFGLNFNIEKTAEVPMYLKKLAYKLKSNLVKAAAFVENTQSVDALLSLNFINPDNIQKFVSKIPSIKATISDLAMLLIASRLGVKEIPESALSTAMTRLVEVVKGLDTLRATQEQQ